MRSFWKPKLYKKSYLVAKKNKKTMSLFLVFNRNLPFLYNLDFYNIYNGKTTINKNKVSLFNINMLNSKFGEFSFTKKRALFKKKDKGKNKKKK